MSRKTILLTGCGGTPTQNVVWALRQHGDRYRLVGAECDPYKLWLCEGFDARYRVPRADDPGYIDCLNEIIAREDVALVHAQPDPEVKTLSAERERLAAPVFLPAPDVVATCHDKHAIKARLEPAGVGTARAVLLEEPADVNRALAELGDEVWIRATSGAAGRGALPVSKAEHGRMWVDYWGGWGRFIAEELLPGRNLAWQGLYHRGELVGSIAWERLAYVMPSVAPSGITGTPAVSRLIDEDEVHDVGRRAVAAVDTEPHGVYGVDMKGNHEGVPYVTEINPGRFFQPSFMYARAGYFIVRRYAELALGDDEATPLEVRARLDPDLLWTRGLDCAPVMKQVSRVPEVGEPA